MGFIPKRPRLFQSTNNSAFNCHTNGSNVWDSQLYNLVVGKEKNVTLRCHIIEYGS